MKKIFKKMSIVGLFIFAFSGIAYSKLPTGLIEPIPVMPTPLIEPIVSEECFRSGLCISGRILDCEGRGICGMDLVIIIEDDREELVEEVTTDCAPYAGNFGGEDERGYDVGARNYKVLIVDSEGTVIGEKNIEKSCFSMDCEEEEQEYRQYGYIVPVFLNFGDITICHEVQ